MASRIQSLGSWFIVLTLLLFAGSAAAQDISPRCEAAVDRAAGHYSKCLFLADARHARHGNAAKHEKRRARCETRFERRFARSLGNHAEGKCTSISAEVIGGEIAASAAKVAGEAAGIAAASVLFVQNAASAALTDDQLALEGVAGATLWFEDRPEREAGTHTTASFVADWAVGDDSFAEDPPNAVLVCETEEGSMQAVVELVSPELVGETLTYGVESLLLCNQGTDGCPESCDNASLFIDGAAASHTAAHVDPWHTATPPCLMGGVCGVDGHNHGAWHGLTAQGTGCETGSQTISGLTSSNDTWWYRGSLMARSCGDEPPFPPTTQEEADAFPAWQQCQQLHMAVSECDGPVQ